MSNYYHYSYAKRGTICSSITPALTSNRKFLQPNSQVYSQVLTHTLRYPGCSNQPSQSEKQPREQSHIPKDFSQAKCNC